MIKDWCDKGIMPEKPKEIDYIEMLDNCASKEELTEVWKSLPVNVRASQDVIDFSKVKASSFNKIVDL
jgi:hypothetical protein